VKKYSTAANKNLSRKYFVTAAGNDYQKAKDPRSEKKQNFISIESNKLKEPGKKSRRCWR
jgi:hypothetical protein